MDEDTKILATFNAYDQSEILRYANVLNYQLALEDLGEELRTLQKYNPEKYKTPSEVIDYLRDRYYEIRTEYGIPEY